MANRIIIAKGGIQAIDQLFKDRLEMAAKKASKETIDIQELSFNDRDPEQFSRELAEKIGKNPEDRVLIASSMRMNMIANKADKRPSLSYVIFSTLCNLLKTKKTSLPLLFQAYSDIRSASGNAKAFSTALNHLSPETLDPIASSMRATDLVPDEANSILADIHGWGDGNDNAILTKWIQAAICAPVPAV